MRGGGGEGRLFPVVEEQYQSLAITNACPYHRSSPTLLSPIQLKGIKNNPFLLVYRRSLPIGEHNDAALTFWLAYFIGYEPSYFFYRAERALGTIVQ